MLALAVAALVITATLSLLTAQSGNRTDLRDTNLIIASERAWAQAAVKGDASTMAGFMTDDYVEIAMETESGKSKWDTTDKATWIDLVRSGREKYTSVEINNFKTYLHGNVATITAEYSQTGTNDGKDISGTGFYIDTWVKKNGKWQLVSSVFP